MGVIIWQCSEAHESRVKHKDELRRLKRRRLEEEMKLELKLKEWQQTKSLAELDRHALRLEGEIDELHARRTRDQM